MASGDAKKDPSGENEEQSQDIVTQCIGQYGRWQLIMTFLLSLFNLPCTWHIYAMTFQAPDVDFWCSPPPILSSLPTKVWRDLSHTAPIDGPYSNGKDNPCLIWDVNYDNFTPESILNHNFGDEGYGTRICNQWSYDELSSNQTVVSEWNLVCNKATMRNTAQMTFLAGVAFGGLISGILSDRLGRKKTLMCSSLLQLLIGFVIAFVPWLNLFLVLRGLLGLISVSIVFTSFVLCMELVDGKFRTISGICFILPVSLGYITSAGFAYFVRDWRYNQMAITLPSVLFLALYWVLPESPRWLLTMGKHEEALKVLKKAAEFNNKKVPENIHKLIQISNPTKTVAESENQVNVFHLFKYPNIRKKSLVLFVLWFSVYFVYYGLVMNTTYLGGDIYISTVLSGAVEIPSIGLSIIILMKLGRRIPMSLTVGGSGIFCLVMSLIGDKFGPAKLAMAVCARFCIAASNIITSIYTAELFPTVIRNIGVGACNISAGLAMVLVPYLWNLASFAIFLPTALLATFGILGGLAALTLPETSNKPLLNTIEEGEDVRT